MIPAPLQMMIIDPLLIEHIKTFKGQIVNARIEIKELRRQLTISKKAGKHWEDSYKDGLSQNSVLGDKNAELGENNRALAKKNKKLAARNEELEASKMLLDRLTEKIGREKKTRRSKA